MALSSRRTPKLVIKQAHPLVRYLFEEMHEQQIGIYELAQRAGVSHCALTDWRSRTTPNVANLEACYNVLGLTLVVQEIKDEGDTTKKPHSSHYKKVASKNTQEQETV